MAFFRRLAFLAVLQWTLLRAAEVPLATALDTSGLAWTTGGAAAWSGQTAVSQDATDAAQASGLSAADTEAWLETTVVTPGYLSWHWRLELGPDQASALEFFVGDESSPVQVLAQNTAWTSATQALDGTGPVKIRWRLVRTAEVYAGVATRVCGVA